MKYIDLFAGIGGFHVALNKLGHECVFASELSPDLCKLYNTNFKIGCHGDITKIDYRMIPTHDILCAGFPCQTFSKAGKQNGLLDARGNLINEVIKILSIHKPRYFILENVRNLLTHNKGQTWLYIESELRNLGYFVDKKIISPHHINIPHHRERIFIIGSMNELDILNIKWIEKQPYKNSINHIIDENNINTNLDSEKLYVLNIWSRFLKELPNNVLPYNPLWSMEFGATYPFDIDLSKLSLKEWKKYKGSFGTSLSNCEDINQVKKKLPNYIIKHFSILPTWKKNYIKKNREFFELYKSHINQNTLSEIINFKQESWKKLEWHSKSINKGFDDKIIQFRGSGVRIKKDDFLPSLVTVSTQIPIIGKYLRYITPEEGAKSQSLPNSIQLPSSNAASFRVLGNMVNVDLVYLIAKELLKDNNNH